MSVVHLLTAKFERCRSGRRAAAAAPLAERRRVATSVGGGSPKKACGRQVRVASAVIFFSSRRRVQRAFDAPNRLCRRLAGSSARRSSFGLVIGSLSSPSLLVVVLDQLARVCSSPQRRFNEHLETQLVVFTHSFDPL